MPRKFSLASPIVLVTGLLVLFIMQAAKHNKVQNDNRRQLEMPLPIYD